MSRWARHVTCSQGLRHPLMVVTVVLPGQSRLDSKLESRWVMGKGESIQHAVTLLTDQSLPGNCNVQPC
jgi:hypothetical protein